MKKTIKVILQTYLFLPIFICMHGQAMGITCTELDGAYVYSQESTPVYLGFFGSQFASESIMNKYGTYGSPYNSLSVRNEYGTYGSLYSSYSANNEFSSTPPKVYKNGVLIAYLTNNTFITGGVSLAAIDASCTFYSTTPSTGNPPPPPPSWVNASDGLYTDKIQVTWATVSATIEYNVYYSESLTGSKYFINSTTDTAMNITGAVPEKIYYFWISSSNAFGEGTQSNQDSGYMASQPNEPPNIPSSPDPYHGASDVSISSSLHWIGGDPDFGDTVSYDVYLDADDSTPNSIICNDTSSTSCSPSSNLEYNTTYYWKVVAQDNNGATKTSSIWSFTTVNLNGDINQDGNLNLTGAILCLQIISGTIPSSTFSTNSDVNQDGKVGIEEVIYILREITINQ